MPPRPKAKNESTATAPAPKDSGAALDAFSERLSALEDRIANIERLLRSNLGIAA